MINNNNEISWPTKRNIFGIFVSETAYDDALEVVMKAADLRKSACVSHLAVHGLIEGSNDKKLRFMLNNFDIIAPDGQPVKFAMNILYKSKLSDRCYGPEFMLRVCQRAAEKGISIYLYGNHYYVVENLRRNLVYRYPKLIIAGCEPSIFRPLTVLEDKDLVKRINDSNVGIVFIGLGCPLQERFAYEHKHKINAVQICVGAAFDFHSGEKKMAPKFMQDYSLEWLFRLSQEPRRLFKRYFITNTIFLFKFFLQLIRSKKY